MNQRQKATSLKYLLNELMDNKKIGNRVSNHASNFSSIDSLTLESILNSGFFTVNESSAVRVIFQGSKTNVINESTVSKIDGIVAQIIEALDSNTVLSEGIFGDIWDGLKKLGNKAKDAITGGWSKLKAVWGEFKELAQDFVEVMKDGFRKGMDKAKSFAMAQLNSFKNEIDMAMEPVLSKLDDVAQEKKFGEEVVNSYKSGEWVASKMKNTVVEKAKWATDVVSGKGSPEEPPKVDPKQAEAGFEQLKTEEGAISKKELVEMRMQMLGNKNVLRELYKSSQRRLNEGSGGSAHLEDAIENPLLKRVIHFCVNLFKYALIPVAAFAQKFAQEKGPAFLEQASAAIKLLGGPGSYKFPMLGLILAELIEIVVKTFTPGTADLAMWVSGIFFPPLVPIIQSAMGVVKIIKTILLVYTVGTILFNVIVSVRKTYTDWKEKKAGDQGGGEPEVQTAGYKPNGKFKLKEGKLVFIS